MLDDSILTGVSFPVASLLLAFLFVSLYKLKRDPLVSIPSFRLSLPFQIYLDDFQLDAIPTVGFSVPILSYLTAIRFIFDGFAMLEYGYRYKNVIAPGSYHIMPFHAFFHCFQLTPSSNSQTRGGLFKIAGLRRWMVLASSPELIEDITKAPDDTLSVNASAAEVRMLPRRLGSYS